MNPISSVLTLHYRDKRSWIIIPISILLLTFAINIIVSFLVPSQEEIYTGGITSIFVYLFVSGIFVVIKTFPFAVGMSIRRSDYFFGTVVMGLLVSIGFSTLIFLMAQLENQLNGWGKRLHFYHFPYVNDGTLVEQFFLYLILLIYLFSFGLLIASFVKRFGGKGIIIASTAILLIGSGAVYLIHSYSFWSTIFSWFGNQTAVQIAYWHLPFVLIYLLASFLLLRKTSV